jgi:FKBP-type peptidyl-prolyl cis-trans isomerase
MGKFRFVALIAALATMMAVSAHAADPSLSAAANQAYLTNFAKQPGVVKTASGLEYKIIRNGFGGRPGAYNQVQVYYSGSLINGKVFDSTEPGLPATFTVNQLIPGWTEALELMREGDQWHIVIPANMAYGSRGAGGAIPANQVLVFDLTLVKVLPPKAEPPSGDGSDSNQ